MGDRVQPGTVIEGTYRIERRIAEGGMGAVYEATHARLDGRYAIKFLHPDIPSRHPAALARFRREARITSALRHPGIVQVIDFNMPADGAPFLVMEYLDGANLGEVIAREAPFPLARVDDITAQIASALSAVHRKGIIHRDLNPSNVFVVRPDGDQPERVKVFDFGISKIRWASKHITGFIEVLGTPQYMAPEQAEGRAKDLDQAADQFSLAAIVYEMLTGHPAFAGDTLATVAYQVVHGMPEPISRFRRGLPAEVEAVLAKGLAKDRRDRFESVSEFAAAFRQAVHPRADAPKSNESDTVVSPPGFIEELAARRGDSGRRARPAPDERRTIVVRHRKRRPKVDAGGNGAGGQGQANDGRPAPGAPGARLPADGRVLAAAAAAGVGILVLISMLAVRSHRERPAPRLTVLASAPPTPMVQPIPPAPPAARSARDAGAAARPSPATQPHARPKNAAPEAEEITDVDPGAVASARAESDRLENELGLAAVRLPAPPASCTVTLGSSPWAAVWIDGKDTGKHTPVVQLPVACGRHILELRRRDLRLEHLATVLLRAGDPLKARYQLEPAD